MSTKKHPHTTDTETPPATKESSVHTFEELGLTPAILRAITKLGYESPTPIQNRSIPPLLEGRDVMGQAQTGTGKTAAFSLPLLQKIDLKKEVVQALVLLPTRELALQVAEAIHSYAKDLGRLKILPIYGGASMKQQLDHLKAGVQVVVGTPGRVIDHLKRGTLSLEHAKYLVLDEADEMLKMGFFDDVNWILEQAPAEDRQIALFSATFPPAIKTMAQRYLQNPVHVKIEQKTATVSTIDQKCLVVQDYQKLEAVTRLLEVEAIEAVLIFTRTKVGASELAEKLLARGYRAEALHSDLSQAERQKVLRRLQSKQSEIVVATDVAARGLDVQHISHVINYDMPNDGEVYTHRIGRTGRAGKSGISILFVTPRERGMLAQIERFTKKPIEMISVPTQKMVVSKRNERFQQRLVEQLQGDLADALHFVGRFVEQQGEDPVRLAAAAISLLTSSSPTSGTKRGEEQPKGRLSFAGSKKDESDELWPKASDFLKDPSSGHGSERRSKRSEKRPAGRGEVKERRDSAFGGGAFYKERGRPSKEKQGLHRDENSFEDSKPKGKGFSGEYVSKEDVPFFPRKKPSIKKGSSFAGDFKKKKSFASSFKKEAKKKPVRSR